MISAFAASNIDSFSQILMEKCTSRLNAEGGIATAAASELQHMEGSLMRC
jgi:hypothetical protein